MTIFTIRTLLTGSDSSYDEHVQIAVRIGGYFIYPEGVKASKYDGGRPCCLTPASQHGKSGQVSPAAERPLRTCGAALILSTNVDMAPKKAYY